MTIADMRRFALLGSLLVVAYFLLRAWNDDFGEVLPAPAAVIAPAPDLSNTPGSVPVASSQSSDKTANKNADVPADVPAAASTVVPTSGSAATSLIEVDTDALHVWIDSHGDLVKLALPGYPVTLDRKDLPYLLLDNDPLHIYTAESGLAGVDGPDANPLGRPAYSATQTRYVLADGAASLDVPMTFTDAKGRRYTKTYRFARSSYEVRLTMTVANPTTQSWRGMPYLQLKRNGEAPAGASSNLGPKPFVGVALTTPHEAYVKVAFEKLKEKHIDEPVTGGWIAILQHYFLVSWIAQPGSANRYFGREGRDGTYLAGFTAPALIIPPGGQANLAATLYAGPKVQAKLDALAPNLKLTVDYGVLWIIAAPLFRMLQWLHSVFNNWGFAIIGLTVLIKAVLYPLSAYSYRSMAKMRDVAPQMKRVQERFADDREKLSKEMMDLYKREKVNPLGGCLPMLVQMPVFLSLYWVLYESVELRQAPFIAWIVDLSIKDPYFVLPLLMGVTMYIQQSLNPPMPDPMQARMMKMMPVVFTVMFAFFPAGLVLYWFINNLLSFLQQWWVTRQVTNAKA